MTLQRRSWFSIPYIILGVGVIISGVVLWQLVNRPKAGVRSVNTNIPSTCGNGICENVACLSVNCPKPETPQNCPQDCATVDTSPSGSTDSGMNVNTNTSTNANTNSADDTSTGLTYSMSTQTLDQKKLCPIEDANLTPDDAVAIARRNGLAQGIQNVAVALYQFRAPLEQCIWEVKNYEKAGSGVSVIIIDATQEVFQKSAWQNTP